LEKVKNRYLFAAETQQIKVRNLIKNSKKKVWGNIKSDNTVHALPFITARVSKNSTNPFSIYLKIYSLPLL